MKRNWIILILPLMLSSCRTVELKNVETLTKHPQFPQAAQAAPEFTRAALRTVADLEYQIERRRK